MHSGAFGRTAAALGLLALAACGGIRAAPEPPIANFETYLIGLQQPYTPEAVTACLGTPLADPQAQICRDKIVQPLIVAIDLRYQQFELGFFDSIRQLDFGTSLAVIGLGTAGAFTPGGVSQILSGTTAALAGTREAFTKTVLAEQTSVALLTAMRAQRDQVRAQIHSRLRLTASEYPLGMALADVSGYYRAGTVVGALTGVTEAVGIERVQARQNLQQAIEDREFVPPVPGVSPAPAGVPIVLAPPPVPGTAAARSRLFVAVGSGREGTSRPDPRRLGLMRQCWKELVNPEPTNFAIWLRSASGEVLDSVTNCINRKAAAPPPGGS